MRPEPAIVHFYAFSDGRPVTSGELESVFNNLQSEVDDFYYEDWSYNVPDVESAAEDVKTTLDGLKYNAY